MSNRMLATVSVLVLACSSPAWAADHAAWLAKVEGFFATQKAKTPVGEIPFAMDMVKEADGSVHGRTWADKESYFDFASSNCSLESNIHPRAAMTRVGRISATRNRNDCW